MPLLRIDMNADVGESRDTTSRGDAALMPWITSASVAAGFHGGSPSVLRRTIRLAKAQGVAVGAHPGFPDLEGFGRRDMNLTAADVEDLVLYQISAVAGVASAEGMALQHVKVHGALYNMAAKDAALAEAIVRALVDFDRSLVLFAPSGSAMSLAARNAGVAVAHEAFADRAYQADGSLASRSLPGALITDPGEVVSRVVAMLRSGRVTALDGSSVSIQADTVCIHSDTPRADRLAASLRAGLGEAGIEVRAPSA